MPPFFQPPVPSLPPGIDLSGKTAIVTGATSGIGLEISRQLLTYKISNLVIAVRNLPKGETVRQALLSDPSVKAANPNATVKVMKLDTASYESVQSFVSAFNASFPDLHLLFANAGIGTAAKELAPSGHEKNIQVNYLSNVLLTLALLPTLETTASKTSSPTRVTWTGSRAHIYSSLAGKKKKEHQLPNEGEGGAISVLHHLSTANDLPMFTRYADSKLLCVLFQLELARHYHPDKVIINSFCPGQVDTNMTDVLPFYLRIPVNAFMAIRARSPKKAAWIALNAAVVAGEETHGRLLEDMVVQELWDFIKTEEGQRVERALWNETVDEMAGLVSLPAWMSKIA
jgi:NAD(P)-dependent dehydrogenase (short-subunit alcohol dehydrogenase family)